MKEKYTLEIAGTELKVITDENEEYLNQLAEAINKRVNELVLSNKRCSRLDAAILCSLEFLDMKNKAEQRINDFTLDYEIQIEDLKKEIAELKKNIPFKYQRT